ncbi:hypothetical protein McanMca71_004402 [Microsporum canis]|uniref:Uncharacterized protein n=1 Tax=Arthroderma otae (strain ATCC MYA-4605 / CBS 113480) TaxID=554155 RepID=C5FPN7_ARTOC|nr:conserved hypothetical protein [Microsporum canis CBS 113480]EEQ31642.1 conserved hypothetical protein [Microsporum canis CBS 113480]
MSHQPPRDLSLHGRLNVPALIRLAKRLRNTTCTYDPSQTPLAGCFNWAVVLSFDDGVEWLLRSPRTSYALNETTAGAVLVSEVATLRYIKQNSSIPVPDVYHYSSSKNNELGPKEIPIKHGSSSRLLTAEQKQKVMVQLGKLMDQLSHLRFDKIGSLFEEEGCFRVKSCLLPSFLFHNRYELQGICRGPFSEESEYYRALLSVYFGHIQHLPLGYHALFAPVPVPKEYDCYASYLAATGRWNDFVTLGSRIENSGNRLDYFVAGQFLEKMIPRLTNDLEECNNHHNGRFALYHPDLSANNIFIDDECNITCIIDWAFASTVPINLLLATPGLPHPRDEWELSLTSAFRSGFTSQSCLGSWEKSRMIWLFMRLVNMDSLQDYHLLAELYTLANGPQSTLLLHAFNEQYNQPAVTDMRNILSADDETATDVERHEKDYFSSMGLDRHAVARKVNLAANLSTTFVADKRLWQWIERALPADSVAPN